MRPRTVFHSTGEYAGLHRYAYPPADNDEECARGQESERKDRKRERRVDCRPNVFVIRNLIIFQLTSAPTCNGSHDVRSSVLYQTT